MANLLNTAKKTEGYIGTENMILVDPEQIDFTDANPRVLVNTPEDKQLGLHLRRGGTVPPLLIRRGDDGRFKLVDGKRRLTQYLILRKQGVQFDSVRCELTDESDPAELLRIALTRNDGKPLNAVEKANAYAQLEALGWKGKEIADKINLTAAHVSEYLTLARATEPVKKKVIAGEMSVRAAVEAIREYEAAQSVQAELKKASIKNGDGVAEEVGDIAPEVTLEQLAEQKHAERQKPKEKNAPKTEPSLAALSEDAGLSLTPDEKGLQRTLDRHGMDGLLTMLTRVVRNTTKLITDKDKKTLWKNYGAAVKAMQESFDELDLA